MQATRPKSLGKKGIDASKSVADSRAKWIADVHTERSTFAEIAPVVRLIRSFAVAKFGETLTSSAELEDFGFTPRKVPTKKVKVKAAAAEQVAATRAVRHTMGKRQKAKVKGTVAAPPQGSTTPAPAPAGNPPPTPPRPTGA